MLVNNSMSTAIVGYINSLCIVLVNVTIIARQVINLCLHTFSFVNTFIIPNGTIGNVQIYFATISLNQAM